MTLTLAAGGAGGIAIDLLVILACAGVTAIALSRLRVAEIPGYLIAGILFGPHGLGLVADTGRIEEITSIATVLLMFSIGMHLDLSAMRRGAVAIITIGAVSTVLSAAVVTGLGLAMTLPLAGALAVGMALSMSSTAVVLRLFQARRELFEAHGRTSVGILLIQDLLVVGMLAALPVLATMQGGEGEGGEPIDLGAAAAQALIAVGAVGLLVVVGRLLLPRVMRFVAAGGNQELMLVVAAAAALGAAVLTGAAGLSPELGAFIAGFLLSSTPFRHHISGQITPLRDLFMAVFFTVVGMRVDPQTVLSSWWVVLAAIVVIPTIKAVIIAATAWAAGAASTVAVRTGLALGQGGEFSLLVLTVAASLGLISPDTEGVVIAAVVATLVITPWSIEHGAAIARRFGRIPPSPWFSVPTIADHPALLDADGEGTKRPTRVIIAGFGPVGRSCAAKLESIGVGYTVVELNARTVWREAELGVPILYGDVTNPEVLENAGIEHAQIVVFTMPDGDAVFRGVRLVRSLRPEIHITVRASLMQVAQFAKELGADEAFVEESAVAEALAASLEARLTAPDAE
ncbi:MAG: potassium transporter KefB [Phycisphaeraceae bacterium]|nr:MAG: potassium transporter KefB [Phycisphaeraceae bacterium]